MSDEQPMQELAATESAEAAQPVELSLEDTARALAAAEKAQGAQEPQAEPEQKEQEGEKVKEETLSARMAKIAKRDRYLSKREKEVEARERAIMQELSRLQSWQEAQQAAQQEDFEALLKHMPIDQNKLYGWMTNRVLNGDIDPQMPPSSPEMQAVLSKVQQMEKALEMQVGLIKQQQEALDQEQNYKAVQQAGDFLRTNAEKYPLLAARDNGEYLWGHAASVLKQNPNLRPGEDITIDQVAEELENAILHELQEQRSLYDILDRKLGNAPQAQVTDSRTQQSPKQIAATITNRAQAHQTPKSLHERTRNLTDFNEIREVMQQYYKENGQL